MFYFLRLKNNKMNEFKNKYFFQEILHMKKPDIFFAAFCVVCAAISHTIAANYFPCVNGNVWQYDVMLENNDGFLDIGNAEWKIIGDTAIGGQYMHLVECDMEYSMGMISGDNYEGVIVDVSARRQASKAISDWRHGHFIYG
jgi:hypothetical protein